MKLIKVLGATSSQDFDNRAGLLPLVVALSFYDHNPTDGRQFLKFQAALLYFLKIQTNLKDRLYS